MATSSATARPCSEVIVSICAATSLIIYVFIRETKDINRIAETVAPGSNDRAQHSTSNGTPVKTVQG